jgi:hypothetical protein
MAGTQVYIEDVDVVDSAPLLDMKPYVPAFDVRAATGIGWFAQRLDRVDHVRADQRFPEQAGGYWGGVWDILQRAYKQTGRQERCLPYHRRKAA